LKSSIYADVLRISKPITVRLRNPTDNSQTLDVDDAGAGAEKMKKTNKRKGMFDKSERRSMSWDFPLSTFGGSELIYVNEVSTNEPLHIVLNGNIILPLKFTKLDNLNALAFEFVKFHQMHHTMGMGCEKGNIDCMSKTLGGAMQRILDEQNQLAQQKEQQEAIRMYEEMLEQQRKESFEREKLLLLHQQKNISPVSKSDSTEITAGGAATATLVTTTGGDDDDIKINADIAGNEEKEDKHLKAKNMELAMARRLKEKLGQVLANAKQQSGGGGGGSENKALSGLPQQPQVIVVGEDGEWEFR
jgi:type II secretory pathway pseudopilin PulG